MSRSKKFFKDVILYSTSTFFSNILNFITAIVVRRVLQPALMGLFNEIMLVFDYAQHSHLGIINSLDKELPYLYGKGDAKKAEAVRNIGFTFCLLVALSISTTIFAVSVFLQFGGNKLLAYGIRFVSFLVLIRLCNSLYIVLNRSRHNFLVISKNTVMVALFDLFLKIILTVKFGLPGLLWASILTPIVGLIYFLKASEDNFKFVFNFALKDIVYLLKIGFPIFITGFIFMTLMNIDRIMILQLLDVEKLGYYTIGLMVNVYVVQLPNLVYAVIFPRFYQAYGERQDITEVKDLFIKPMLIFAYLFPVLVGCVIIVLPLLVHYMLPAYLPGLLPAYLLLLGSSFIALVNMPGYLLVVLNKQGRMVLICGSCVLLGAAFIYLFVRKFNLGLSGAAIGASLAYFCYATALSSYAFKNYTRKISHHLRFLMELYLPFLWAVLSLLCLRSFSSAISGDIIKDLGVVFYREVVFVLTCLPLILYANKKTDILAMLKRAYIKKEASIE